MILCWSAKGGSGTTVVAATLALSLAERVDSPPAIRRSARHRHGAPLRSLSLPASTATPNPRQAWPHLIDLAGDVPMALGLPVDDGPGIYDWMASAVGTVDSLAALARQAGQRLRIVPAGNRAAAPDWERLAAAVGSSPVVIDCGTGAPPAALVSAARQSLLVTRACYMGLMRAIPLAAQATGVVLVREPGRHLGLDDIERSLGVPVVATIEFDPAIARCVDAGLALSRLPRSLKHLLPQAFDRAG